MKRWRTLLGNERGVALVLALMILLTLTGLVLAFLSVSAFEPQISRNLADTTRARYLAEAGLEVGYNALIATADWSSPLASATTASPWIILPNMSAATLPGLDSASGTYTVSVRNDYQASDNALTGVAVDTGVTTDANMIVIMRATGTYNNAAKTLEVVVKRLALPPFPGAVNLPGNQADTYINTQNFEIDGRDYTCPSNLDCSDAANWSTSDPADKRKFALTTQTGTQSNLGVTYEARVESAFGTSGSCGTSCSDNKKASVKGKSEVDGSFTTGLNTIQADSSLNPSVMSGFLGKLAAFPGTTVLQSNMACPMVFAGRTGTAPDGTPNSTRPTLSNGGGACSSLLPAADTVNGCSGVCVDLGTRDNPKLVYFRGELDTTSAFTGLKLNNSSSDPPIKGAGILVVEDGDMRNYGNFDWDGVVIVTGAYTSAAFFSGSITKVRGAMAALEGQAGETNGYFEFYLAALANQFSIRNSKQNLDMVQTMRGLHSMSSWREI